MERERKGKNGRKEGSETETKRKSECQRKGVKSKRRKRKTAEYVKYRRQGDKE